MFPDSDGILLQSEDHSWETVAADGLKGLQVSSKTVASEYRNLGSLKSEYYVITISLL